MGLIRIWISRIYHFQQIQTTHINSHINCTIITSKANVLWDHLGLGHHLHQKDGGARHFGEDVGEGHLQLLVSAGMSWMTLVGGIPTPLKNLFVSWDDFPFPTVSGKSFKIPWFQSPPTSRCIIVRFVYWFLDPVISWNSDSMNVSGNGINTLKKYDILYI